MSIASRAPLLFLSIFLLLSSSCMAAERKTDNAPRLSFMESWSGPSKAQKDVVLYELTCLRKGARLVITGYQIDMNLSVKMEADRSSIKVVFLDGQEDDLGPTYRSGDVLFRFSKKSGSLWTEWDKLRPFLRANDVPGVHFRADGRKNSVESCGIR